MHLDNFHFKKNFGQNFIKEDAIVEKIKNVADIQENSLIIEIGPGAGSLTKKLATVSLNSYVLAYEIDEQLKPILEKEFQQSPHVSFIFDDFLKRDLKQDLMLYSYQHLYVVANLPYYITTPILEKVIRELDVDKMVIMVQKEVGYRFTAKVGTKDYNSLTIFLDSYFDVRLEFPVSRNCFIPKPNVDSVVVSLTKKQNPYSIFNRKHFEKLVRDSFQFKRKTLRNNLKGYDLERIETILEKYGHNLTSRAEAITVSEFVEISNDLYRNA